MTEQVVLKRLLAYCAYPQTRMAGLVRDCLLIFNIQHRSSSIVCLKTGPGLHSNVQMVRYIKINENFKIQMKQGLSIEIAERQTRRQMSWRGFVLRMMRDLGSE